MVLKRTHTCRGTARGLVATLKPQSPDENDTDKNCRDYGAFRAELLCNRHQLHSNGLRPTQLMAQIVWGSKGRTRLTLRRVALCYRSYLAFPHQIPVDALASVFLDVDKGKIN